MPRASCGRFIVTYLLCQVLPILERVILDSFKLMSREAKLFTRDAPLAQVRLTSIQENLPELPASLQDEDLRERCDRMPQQLAAITFLLNAVDPTVRAPWPSVLREKLNIITNPPKTVIGQGVEHSCQGKTLIGRVNVLINKSNADEQALTALHAVREVIMAFECKRNSSAHAEVIDQCVAEVTKLAGLLPTLTSGIEEALEPTLEMLTKSFELLQYSSVVIRNEMNLKLGPLATSPIPIGAVNVALDAEQRSKWQNLSGSVLLLQKMLPGWCQRLNFFSTTLTNFIEKVVKPRCMDRVEPFHATLVKIHAVHAAAMTEVGASLSIAKRTGEYRLR